MIAIEDELAGVRILAQLTVLKELDGQIVRIDLRLHVRPQRRECVEGFAARPLTFRILNRPVADILRRGVAEDVTGGSGGCDVADAAAHHDCQLRLEIGPMLRERDFDLAAVRKQGGGRLQPEERFFGDRLAGLARMVGII